MKELRCATLARLLLVSLLLSFSLSLSLSQGLGRNANAAGLQPKSNTPWQGQHHRQEHAKMRREMEEVETADYDPIPKANVNPKTGPLLNPSTPTPTPTSVPYPPPSR